MCIYIYTWSYLILKSKNVVKCYVHISPIFSCWVAYDGRFTVYNARIFMLLISLHSQMWQEGVSRSPQPTWICITYTRYTLCTYIHYIYMVELATECSRPHEYMNHCLNEVACIYIVHFFESLSHHQTLQCIHCSLVVHYASLQCIHYRLCHQ